MANMMECTEAWGYIYPSQCGYHGGRQYMQKADRQGSVISGSRDSVYCLYGCEWSWTAWRSYDAWH